MKLQEAQVTERVQSAEGSWMSLKGIDICQPLQEYLHLDQSMLMKAIQLMRHLPMFTPQCP